MKVYFIIGLGADKRAFQRIHLPEHYRVHFLEWIPQRKNEKLEHYAGRLVESVDTSQPFVLIGLSFGGIIAATVAPYLKPAATILISSISSRKELPPLFKLAAFTYADQLLPLSLFRPNNPLVYYLFGARTKAEKRILQDILEKSDPSFLKWGIEKILHWKNKKRPQGLFHIHGKLDKILPVQYTKADVIIEKGTHFMIWTRASDVTKAILHELRRHSQE